MKRIVRETLSSIEIEEILADHFNSFDSCLLIKDTEEGQMVYAEIIDWELNLSFILRGNNIWVMFQLKS